MLKFEDLDPSKKAYIFELDNVLYSERDYLLQVYYLFANFLEFTETTPSSRELTEFLKTYYQEHGTKNLYETGSKVFGIAKQYEENFLKLHYTARLPLKLILYDQMLTLLQEMIVDRKEIFLVTNGDPRQQLNKIKQLEWKGLEKYLVVYFANEIKPKPETDVLEYVIGKHQLLRKDITIIGKNLIDKEFASAGGVDFINVTDFFSTK
ncbi:MAG: HAD hydrolase-like protein [Flavobacterium sp.]|nr:HAD hydrolase-like protein [Pedobacter sp.]